MRSFISSRSVFAPGLSELRQRSFHSAPKVLCVLFHLFNSEGFFVAKHFENEIPLEKISIFFRKEQERVRFNSSQKTQTRGS